MHLTIEIADTGISEELIEACLYNLTGHKPDCTINIDDRNVRIETNNPNYERHLRNIEENPERFIQYVREYKPIWLKISRR